MPKDTAVYKPLRCYQCGDIMRSYWFNDVCVMRIDGKKHNVPVKRVPCHRCDTCDIAVTDGSSDEAFQLAYKEYLCSAGLNTPWLVFKRWVRRRCCIIRDRWNWYWLRLEKRLGRYPD